MKFFNQYHRLMSAAEELDGGGFDDSGSEGVADETVSEFAGDDEDLIGESWDDVFKDSGLDPKKYGLTEEDESVETEEEDSQGGEGDQEAGQGTDEKSLLDHLNSLGLVHNENPLRVESLDEVKNLIQMGKDYTLKTQSLSEERKAWEAEKKSAEDEINGAVEAFNKQAKELETQLQEMQQFRFALDQLKANAPDVFEEVQRAYEDVGSRFKNPILDQQMEAINKRLSEAESQLKSREDKLIIDEFEREKEGLSATEQSLKELGVTVNWDEAKKQWAKTGLPLKQVIGSLYFDQVAKAQASKNKVEQTRAKTKAKPTGVASASRPGKKVQPIDPKLKGMALVDAIWKRHTTN